MDNTLTGAIQPGDAYNPEMNAAQPGATKKRDVKYTWKYLGSITALLVALGAVVEQGAGLSEKIIDAFNMFRPSALEWTEDEMVILEPGKNVDAFTIEVCDSTQESGESLHIALLLEKSKTGNDNVTPAFVLKRQGKGCREEAGRVFMNPNDFDEHIKQPRKADFILTYGKAHLYGLDELVKRAFEKSSTVSSVKVTGGNKS